MFESRTDCVNRPDVCKYFMYVISIILAPAERNEEIIF